MTILITDSRKTSSTLFHYSPLSTTSSTLFHYAPLSSATSISNSPHSTTISSYSATTPICSPLPASTSQIDSLLASSSPTPPPTATPGPGQAFIPDSEISDPSMGLTVVVLTLLGFLMVMTVIIWWTEMNACKDSRHQECQTHITSSQMRDTEPVGLGITIQPAKEEKKAIEHYERLRCWIVRFIGKARVSSTVERWTDYAVAMLRAELDKDAEKGLLLPVQENERSKGEKDRIEIISDPDRKC
jgi:hypothetical protein